MQIWCIMIEIEIYNKEPMKSVALWENLHLNSRCHIVFFFEMIQFLHKKKILDGFVMKRQTKILTLSLSDLKTASAVELTMASVTVMFVRSANKSNIYKINNDNKG